MMTTVREIEARLASEVEDGVLSRLGYREFEVIPPNGVAIVPRPQVKQVDLVNPKNQYVEGLLQNAGIYRATAVFELLISRVVAKSVVTQFGTWTLTHDEDGSPVTCQLLDLKIQDARWKLLLAVIREDL